MTDDRQELSLTLWDSSVEPPASSDTVYRWNGYAESSTVHSLLRYVELNATELRRRYVEWIHDLGVTRIKGKSVIEHLALEEGFSYWWMTLLAEKSYGKSRSISAAIRVLAFEEILRCHMPSLVRVVSRNRDLTAAVGDLCARLEIRYAQEPGPDVRPEGPTTTIQRSLPTFIQALASLGVQIVKNAPFRRRARGVWNSGAGSTLFCSYFDNVDGSRAECGEFFSYYWQGLHDVLRSLGRRPNWLHVFVPSATAPNATAAIRVTRRFSATPLKNGAHGFVGGYLSWGGAFRVFRSWIRLNLARFGALRSIEGAFRPRNAAVSLWPLMRADWHASLSGSTAMHNLVWKESFDLALQEMPRQASGAYLCENQAWERALIHAWRKYGHGRLAAVQHTTVRFWDLRYFVDPRSLSHAGPYGMPQPSVTVLNGPDAINAYGSAGYPMADTEECEALRFQYLAERPAARTAPHDRSLRVLILGDIVPAATRALLVMAQAVAERDTTVRYVVKPHPNCPVDPLDFSGLNLGVVTDPLATILGDCNIAFASATTSAAVDAYLYGLPVAVLLDDSDLNLSPLRGRSDVRFVSTAGELAEAFAAARQTGLAKHNPESFFCLDPALPRWQYLLNHDMSTAACDRASSVDANEWLFDMGG